VTLLSSQFGKGEKPYGSEPYASRIPNKPIREAVEKYIRDYETNYTALAKELGMITRNRNWIKGDDSSLRRMLGLEPEKQKDRTYRCRATIQYDNAVRIIRQIGRDPWEFDV
jgi:hypothetical protein